jgi:putative transcriptional regulator
MPLIEAGRVLVARPGLMDPHFKATVVLVFQHDRDSGTMGVVVNRPSPARLRDVVEKVAGVDGREDVLWYGGPCQPNAVWVLHRRPDVEEPGSEVAPGLFLGGTPALLTELLTTTAPNPGGEMFRVVRGYAGWAPGQLAREIREGSWRVDEADPEILFGAQSDPLWEDVLTRSQLPFRLPPEVLRRARWN